jgi:hypothetical protein
LQILGFRAFSPAVRGSSGKHFPLILKTKYERPLTVDTSICGKSLRCFRLQITEKLTEQIEKKPAFWGGFCAVLET